MSEITGRDPKNRMPGTLTPGAWMPGDWIPGAGRLGARLVLALALVMAPVLTAFFSPSIRAVQAPAQAPAQATVQSTGAKTDTRPPESFAFDADRFEMENDLYKLFGGPDGPAVAYFGNNTLSGQYIEYRPDIQLVRVERQVRLDYVMDEPPGNSTAEETPKNRSAGPKKDSTKVVVTADSAVADLRAGRIVARGSTQRVRIDYGGVTATSQEATLFTGERRLVLVGRPEVRSRGDLLTAGEITLFLADGRVVGQGGVRLTIVQEQSTGQERAGGDKNGSGGNRGGSN